MRLTSWLNSLRSLLYGTRTQRARRLPLRLGHATECLERRTLLSASYSLELVNRDALEGAAAGSGNTAEFLIRKTANDEWGSSMGVFLALPETGTALATPDQAIPYSTQLNDYYFVLGDANGPQLAASRIAGTGQLGINISSFVGPGDAVRIFVVGRQDYLAEGTENIPLQLVTQQVGYGIDPQYDFYHDTIGENGTLNLRIVESTPTVTVTASDSEAREPAPGLAGDSGTLTFTRSGGDPTQPLTVNIGFGGTATNGLDFPQCSTSVTFPANQQSVSLQITPTSDSLMEFSETAVVTLASGSGYIVGTPATATITIADPPPPDVAVKNVGIAISGALADEDNSQGGVASQTFVITRVGGVTGDLTVYVSLSGSATNGTDYSALPTTSVVIPDGESSVSLVVNPIYDSIHDEGNETVQMALTGTSDPDVSVDDNHSIETISIRDANYPVVSISTSIAVAKEVTETGDPGHLQMLVHVDRAAEHCSYPVTVPYTISTTDREGVVMATAGADYVGLSGAVTIVGTATSELLNIYTIWDKLTEPTETVELTLNSVGTTAYYSLGSSTTAAATIQDVTISVVSLAISNPDAAEEGPNDGPPVPALLTFTRESGDITVPVSVSFSYHGSATLGADFTGLTLPVTIPANLSSITVLATPVWDTRKEGPLGANNQPTGIEDFIIELTDGRGYDVSPNQTAQTFTITDAPTPVISVTASDAEAGEDDGVFGFNTGEWIVSRTGGTTQPLTITVNLSGDAIPGTDFTTSRAVTSSITIPAGSSSINVRLDPLWNEELEPVAPDGSVPSQYAGQEHSRLSIVDTIDYDVSPTNDHADIWIKDAPLSIVTIAAASPDTSEQGGPDNTPESTTVTVSRTGSTSKSLQVSLGINAGLNGSGYASPSDYAFSQNLANGITIPQGASSVTFTVTPAQDVEYSEGDELLRLQVASSSTGKYAVGTPDVADITIHEALAPLITVAATSTAAQEEGWNGNPVSGTWTLTRTGALTSALTVNLQDTYLTGSAFGGADYQLAAGTSSNWASIGTFPIGVSSITVSLNPVWDERIEGDEIVKLQVVAAANSAYRTESASDSAQITILDRPAPFISISTPYNNGTSNHALEEGPDGNPVPGYIRISRLTGSNLHPLNVTLGIDGTSTATSGVDYDGPITSHHAVIPAGYSYVDVALVPLLDTENQESDESVVVVLTPSSLYQISGATTTVVIEDSPTPRVSINAPNPNAPDPAASEPGSKPVVAGSFTVSRIGRGNQSLAVRLAVGGTATAGADFTSNYDLSSSALTVTFSPNEFTKTITITPVADLNYAEGTENITLSLISDPAYQGVLEQAQASVEIADANDLMTFQLVATRADTGETVSNYMNEMMGMPPDVPPPALATLTRTGRIDQPVTVQVHVGGDATYGSDYTSTPGRSGTTISVSFAANEASKTIQITAITDTEVEVEEFVTLSISETSEYHVGASHSVVLGIHDNHSTVTVEATDRLACEPSGMYGIPDNGIFTFRRVDGDLSQPLVVNFSLSGTAMMGAMGMMGDYFTYSDPNGTTSTITIPAWQMSASLTLYPNSDALAEGLEVAVLTIMSGANYAVGTPKTDYVNIGDSMIASFVVTAPDPDATEPQGLTTPDVAVFTISQLGGTSTGTTNVTFTFSGSATLYTDYQPTGLSYYANGYGSIQVGASGATITITPDPDTNWNENNETVILRLDDQFVSSLEAQAYQQAEVRIHDATRPQVTVTASDPQAAEELAGNQESGAFTLTRTGSLAEPLQVTYSTSTGSATSGTDYQLAVGPGLSGYQVGYFPAGVASISVIVQPYWDDIVEGDESVIFQLSPNNAYSTTSPNDSATVAIIDRPAPRVSISVMNNAQEEGQTGDVVAGKIRISRTGTTFQPLTVHYNLNAAGNTATKNVDYTGTILGTSVVIPAGATYVDLVLDPVQDYLYNESLEHVIATLETDPKYLITGGPADLTIADTPVKTVTIVSTDSEASEPASANQPAEPGKFTITRTGNLSHDLTVNLTFAGGTVDVATDVTLSPNSSGSVTIPAGQSSVDIVVTPVLDTIPESDETLKATLVASSPEIYRVGSSNTAIMTIHDMSMPQVTVTANDSEAKEEGANGNPESGSFTLTRTGSLASSLQVTYSVSTGSATNDSNYHLAAGANLAGNPIGFFPIGVATITVLVNPEGDDIVENNETVVFQISPTASYTTATPPGDSATVTITDRPTPLVSINAISNAQEEDSAGDPVSGIIRISRLGSTFRSLTVYFNVDSSGNSATKYIDYNGSILFGSAEIPAGQSFVDLTVDPSQDNINNEGLELVIARLTANARYQINGGLAGVTIADQAMPQFSIVATDSSAVEPAPATSTDNGFGTFTVYRQGGHKKNPVTVNLDLVNTTSVGAATVGLDYTSSPDLASGHLSLTFGPGEFSKTITIQPQSDNLVESTPETVSLIIAADPANYTTSGGGPATVSIADGPIEQSTVQIWAYPSEVAEVSTQQRSDAQVSGIPLTYDSSFSFVVTRSGPVNQPLTVTVNMSGSARKGEDYSKSSTQSGDVDFAESGGTVTVHFAAGQTAVPFNYFVVDNTAPEEDETVIAKLDASANNYTIGAANSAKVTIHDNDTTVQDATQSNGLQAECGCETKLGSTEDGQGVDGVYVDYGDGQLSYNPWGDIIGDLRYDEYAWIPMYISSSNPHPIISVDIQLPKTGPLPTTIDAVLRFGDVTSVADGTLGAVPVPDHGYYRQQTFTVPQDATNGATYRISLLTDASLLNSGQYDYGVEITNHYGLAGVTDTTTEVLGSTQVFNQIHSNLGNRWVIPGSSRIQAGSGGITVLNGNASGGRYAISVAADGEVPGNGTGSGNGVIPAVGTTMEAPDGTFSQMAVEIEYGQTVISISTPGERKEVFDPFTGNLLRRYDRLNQATTFTYVDLDGDQKATDLSKVTFPDGRYFQYDYADIEYSPEIPLTERGKRIASFTDFNGVYARTSTFEHDSRGLLTKITGPDPDGGGSAAAPELTFIYEGTTKLLSEAIDPANVSKNFGFDSTDRRLRSVAIGGESVLSLLPAEVQALGTMIPIELTGATVTDASGTSKLQLDRFGSVVRETDSQGAVTQYIRDRDSQITKMISPTGLVTSYQNDQFGRLTKVQYPDNSTEVWTYPANLRGDHPLSHTDANGYTETFAYDNYGNVTSHRDFDGTVTTYPEYADRNPTREIRSSPNKEGLMGPVETTWEFDPVMHQVAKETDLMTGQVTQHKYDPTFGWLKTDIDGLGHTTSYNRDIWGRVLSMAESDPDGAGPLTSPVTTYHYDALGRLDILTQPDGVVTHYVYNWRDEVTSVATSYPSITEIDPVTHLTSTQVGTTLTSTTTYNGLGLPLTETDEAGNTTTYQYFADGQLQSIAYPDPDGTGPAIAPHESFTKEALTHHITSYTDVLGHVTTYQYDTRDRIISQTDYLGAVTTFELDGNGNILAAHFQSQISSLQYSTAYQYDGLGRVTQATDEFGHTTEYHYNNWGDLWYSKQPSPASGSPDAPLAKNKYDSQGRLIETHDSAHGTTVYAYDDAGNLEQTTAPDGTATQSTFDALGRKTTTKTTADGRITAYAYNARGQLASVTDPDGVIAYYSYNVFGDIRQIATLYPTPAGGTAIPPSVVSMSYDVLGRVLSVSSPQEGVAYEYDHLGRLVTERDSTGRKVTATYDTAGRVKTVTSEVENSATPTAATTTYFYNDQTLEVLEINPVGLTSKTRSDELGRTIRQDLPDGTFYTITYPSGNVQVVADALGNQTTYQYDNLNRLVKVTDALSNETALTYDTDGHVATATDAKGNTVTWQYDTYGRLTSRGSGSNTETWTYDNALRTVTAVDTLGRSTTSKYDVAGRLQSVTDPLNGVTQYQYDAAGRMTQVTAPDPDGSGPLAAAVTQFKYDTAGRTSEIINAKNNHEYFSYDTQGHVASATDFEGHTSSFTYDPRNGQIKTVTDPLNRVTTYDYDSLGRLMQVTDPLNHTTASIYAPATGQLIQSRDADNNSTFYTYDAVGNLKTLKDPENNLTTWTYDAVNRPVSEATTDGTRSYTYDAVGNLASVTDRLGQKRTFDYQYIYDGRPDYQVTHEKWLAGSQTVRDIAYSYTSTGQLASVTDPSATYQYTYDTLGRLQTVSNAGTSGVPTTLLSYGYQPQNRQRTVSATVNGVGDFLNTYTYDVLGQLTTLTQEGVAGGHTVAPKRVDFAYNKVGQFSQISRSADLAGSLPVADSGYSYNASGDLIGLSYGQPMGPNHTNPASLAGYSWTYDSAGRITGFSSPDGMTNYSYDAAGQLQAATHNPLVQANESYSYDANGNRTMPGYQTSANNRLVSDGTSTYEYDAEGHRTKQTEISTGNYVTYDWDYRSRLISVTSHTSNGTVSKQVRYTYDAFDRRIVKEVDSKGNGTYEKAEAYVYDGSDIVLVADGAGSLTNRYLHGPAVDQILADEQISSDSQIPSTVLWAFADNQGTVRDWAQRNSSTGETKIVDHLVYDAYGQIIAHTNPQPGQTTTHNIHYAYTGREWDADANLYYYRARWYDAHAGRFISEDPLGFVAGDTNVQRYVGNSPTNAIDPSGMEDIASRNVHTTETEHFKSNSWTLRYWDGMKKMQTGQESGWNFINPTSEYCLPWFALISAYGIATDVIPGGIGVAGADGHRKLSEYQKQNRGDPIAQGIGYATKGYIYAGTVSGYLSYYSTGAALGGPAFGAVAEVRYVGPVIKVAGPYLKPTFEIAGAYYLSREIGSDLRSGFIKPKTMADAMLLSNFSASHSDDIICDSTRSFDGAKPTDRTVQLRNFGSKRTRTPNNSALRQVGSRGVRNTAPLTESEIAEVRKMAGQIGLGPDDIQFVRTPSVYFDTFDKILLGPNVLPVSPSARTTSSVFERLTPRAVVAHEGGHLITSRAGKALEAGSLLDEVQASLVARQMRGLSKVERIQLLRDAVERARNEGKRVRDLLPELPYFKE